MDATDALWDGATQRQLFRSRSAQYMVSGTLRDYSFARLAADLKHALRICAAARAEGFGHIEVYRYGDGVTGSYRKGRGVTWLYQEAFTAAT